MGVLLSLSGGGILRYCSGIEISTASFLSLLGGLIFALLAFYKTPLNTSRRSIIARPVLATLALIIFWSYLIIICIYKQAPGGLFAVGGADNASHLGLIGEFVSHAHRVYNGFVIFAGLVGGLVSCFNLETADALSIAIYGSAILATSFLALTVSCCIGSASLSAFTSSLVAALVTLGFISIFTPLTYYNVGEGFWPHITSFAVLAAAWAGQACLSSPVTRIVGLLASIALYRFFYGLNLADLSLTSAILICTEARYFARIGRAFTFSLSLLLFAMGIYAYLQILPLATIGGGITLHNRQLALTMTALTAICAIVSWLLAHRIDKAIAFNFIAFPLVFSLISAGAEWLYDLNELPNRYYIFKYGLHRTLLLSIASPLIVGTSIAITLTAIHRTRGALLLIVALCLATTVATYNLYEAYSAYRGELGFLLAQQGKRKSPELLFSKTVVSTIRNVLKKEDKSYIGTIGTQFPSIPFLNTYMNFNRDGHSAIFKALALMDQGISNPPAGGCVFWLKRGPFHSTPIHFPNAHNSIQAYDAMEKKVCLKKIDERGRPFKLCYLCG